MVKVIFVMTVFIGIFVFRILGGETE